MIPTAIIPTAMILTMAIMPFSPTEAAYISAGSDIAWSGTRVGKCHFGTDIGIRVCRSIPIRGWRPWRRCLRKAGRRWSGAWKSLESPASGSSCTAEGNHTTHTVSSDNHLGGPGLRARAPNTIYLLIFLLIVYTIEHNTGYNRETACTAYNRETACTAYNRETACTGYNRETPCTG